LLISSSGTAENRIIYSAYGEGDKPIFSGVVDLMRRSSGMPSGWNLHWSNPDNWVNEGNNVWSTHVSGGNYARVWLDGVEKEKARSNTAGVGITKEHPWQKINYRFYVYSVGNPANTFTSMKITSGDFSSSASKSKNYITWNNLDIQGWDRITISGGSHWIIEHSNLGKYSSAHALLISRDGDTLTTNGIIRHNTFDSAFPFYMVRPDEGIIATQYALTLHNGGQINWDIHDNYFAGWGYCAFGWTNHHENGFMTEGIRFFNNYYTGEGLSYGRAFGGHQYLAQVNENNPIEIFNNVFYSPAVQSQIGTPYLRVYNNVFIGARGKNDAGSSTGANALSFSGYPGRQAYKNKIYNNIFAYNGFAGKFWSLREGRDSVEDVELVNNIFYNNGEYNKWRQLHISDFSSNSELINPRIENNIFWSDKETKIIGAKKTSITVADFNALNGYQNLYPKGNMQVNPLFVDPENNDFRLKANSPAIGAGINVGLINDHDGKQFKSTPSIGPYEYYP
jgi:hypothetical protein